MNIQGDWHLFDNYKNIGVVLIILDPEEVLSKKRSTDFIKIFIFYYFYLVYTYNYYIYVLLRAMVSFTSQSFYQALGKTVKN